MSKEVAIRIEAEGFVDPIIALVSFEGFVDPIIALDKLKVFEVPVFLKLRVEGGKRDIEVRANPVDSK